MSDLQKKRAQKRFYEKHKERRNALTKAWKRENRPRCNRYMQEYRAKRKSTRTPTYPPTPSRNPADY